MNLEEYKGVFVFAQQVDNQISGIAYELLGKAKELAAAGIFTLLTLSFHADISFLASTMEIPFVLDK